MNTLEITQLRGKGAVPAPLAMKAGQYVLEMPLGAPAIDWNRGYRVEVGFTVPQTDQGPTFRCTAEGTSYYGEALNMRFNNVLEAYSRRYIYSQSYIPPEGGAYIWKAMSIPVIKGYSSIASVPDAPLTEESMRDTSLNDRARIEAQALKYAQIPSLGDIDRLAAIIEAYGGFVTGFQGTDSMFSPDGTANIPSRVDWGHCVWVCGYGMRNGKKVLIFKNSWSRYWGDNGYGYFPIEFVASPYLFDAYVYAEIKDIRMMKERIIHGVEQYSLEGGNIRQIPDVETLNLLVEEKVVGSDVRTPTNDEFNRFVKAEPWPSVKVNRLARTFFDGAKDAFIEQ